MAILTLIFSLQFIFFFCLGILFKKKSSTSKFSKLVYFFIFLYFFSCYVIYIAKGITSPDYLFLSLSVFYVSNLSALLYINETQIINISKKKYWTFFILTVLILLIALFLYFDNKFIENSSYFLLFTNIYSTLLYFYILRYTVKLDGHDSLFQKKSKTLELLVIIGLLFVSLAILGISSLSFPSETIKSLTTAALVFINLLISLRLAFGKTKYTNMLIENGIPISLQPLSLVDENIVSNQLAHKLTVLFEKDKLYLATDININNVARLVSSNKTYVSRVLNDVLGKNFRDFVNYYRIMDAMKLCESEPELEIYEIYTRCGFRNIASFNTAFKLNTGYTPGVWRKLIKSQTVIKTL